jgi:hypothetical protein
MSAWIKRFGLHLAAAVGATGVFVAAAAVGASQTRQQAVIAPPTATVRARPAGAQPKPRVVVSPTPIPATGQRQAGTGQQRVNPERSVAGTIKDVLPDGLDVVGVGGREWHVEPVPGALLRRNGKAAKLDAFQPGDGVVILGQAQPGPGARFVAHAITAKSK